MGFEKNIFGPKFCFHCGVKLEWKKAERIDRFTGMSFPAFAAVCCCQIYVNTQSKGMGGYDRMEIRHQENWGAEELRESPPV